MFINLPPSVTETVSRILLRTDARTLSASARLLHDRYMTPDYTNNTRVQSSNDKLAYLAMRFPATYAQIYSALSQLSQRLPEWKPDSILDLGCGPGTGIIAATEIWPSIHRTTGIDREQYFLRIAEEITYNSKKTLSSGWRQATLVQWMASDTNSYDLIIVANVLNEIPHSQREEIINACSAHATGIVLVLEPGTSSGFQIIQNTAKYVHGKKRLVAPYIDNTFVESDDYWIHFSQRFQRPEFQRRIRQGMRENSLMASDWEDATYCFVAWGNASGEKKLWGLSIGKVEKFKGYLILPVLTKDGILQARVLKRHKDIYNKIKYTKWGELIEEPIELS